MREQIAGDVLFPDDPQAYVATGFLAAGPWDFVGHQELREGTIEKDNTRLLDRDDIVATAISSFVSMTAHCARCHDHKFDPIPQQDYYNLQAVFAGIDRADRPWDDDPAVHRSASNSSAEAGDTAAVCSRCSTRSSSPPARRSSTLDSSIQDASLQIAHIGEPKTAGDAETKKQLEARRAARPQAQAGTCRRDRRSRDVCGYRTDQGRNQAGGRADRASRRSRSWSTRAPLLHSRGNVPAGVAATARSCAFAGQCPIARESRGPGRAELRPSAESTLRIANGADEGSRRAALANWIADPDNMLTWRSIVNRVWHYHFGAGLVDTPSDFGRMGSQAHRIPNCSIGWRSGFAMTRNGSLKQLHRLILTQRGVSATVAASRGWSESGRRQSAALANEPDAAGCGGRARFHAVGRRASSTLTVGGPAVRAVLVQRRPLARLRLRALRSGCAGLVPAQHLSVHRAQRAGSVHGAAGLSRSFRADTEALHHVDRDSGADDDEQSVRRANGRAFCRARQEVRELPSSDRCGSASAAKPTENGASSAYSAYARQARAANLVPAAVQQQRISVCGLRYDMDRRSFLWNWGGGLGRYRTGASAWTRRSWRRTRPPGVQRRSASPRTREAGDSAVHVRRREPVRHIRLQAAADRKAGEKWDPGEKVELFQSNPGVVMPSPWGWKQHGQCGKWVSDLLPQHRGLRGRHRVRPFAACRSRTCTAPRHSCKTPASSCPDFPSAGSWISYALGSVNENLPDFVVLPDPARYAAQWRSELVRRISAGGASGHHDSRGHADSDRRSESASLGPVHHHGERTRRSGAA